VVLILAFSITTTSASASASASKSSPVLIWADHGLHSDHHHVSFDDAVSKAVSMATLTDVVRGMASIGQDTNHKDRGDKPEVIIFVAQEKMDTVDNIRRALVSTTPSLNQPLGSWVIGQSSSQQPLDVMALTEGYRKSVPLESSYSPIMHVNIDTIHHVSKAFQSQKSSMHENQEKTNEKSYVPVAVVISVSMHDEMDLSTRGETATLVIARAIHEVSALVDHKLCVVWMESVSKPELESKSESRIGRKLLQDEVGEGADEVMPAAEQEHENLANISTGQNVSNPQPGAGSPGKQTTASGIMPPPISSEGFMALLVCALLLLIFVPGFLCLFHIQTPYAFESAESAGDVQKKMQ